MEALVGNSFVDASGKTSTLKDIIQPGTKAIGLYFSAHWCPPCRQFTPLLAKFYTEDLKKQGLEIIFVSSDKDEGSFKGYLGEMPWKALPFADRDRKNKLSSKFKVQGIPSFVILDTNGELITDGGRAAVMQDPKGVNLPWRPKGVLEILNSGKYLTKTGTSTSFAELTKGAQAVGLYFSAHWCGPCKRFTPILSQTYTDLSKADEASAHPQRLQIIFVSADHDEASFKGYFDSMPWAALEFGSEIKDLLDERFKVEGIPSLVLIDPKTGATINENGVQVVSVDPKGENFPWAPQSVDVLDQASAGSIGPTPAVFVFCETDEKAKEIQKDLIAAVNVWRGKEEPGAVCHGDVCLPTGPKLEGTEDVLFFVCGANPIVGRVRELAQAEGVTVAMLDLSGPFYAHAEGITSVDKVTPMAVRKFVQGVLAGTVQKRPVKM